MIPLIIGIAALGLVFLATLGKQVFDLNSQASLKRHRSKEAGLADLLMYSALVADDVVVCKNGSFMMAWIFQCADAGSSTDEQKEAVRLRINAALAKLGNGWVLHIDAVRRVAAHYPDKAASFFPDLVTETIDEERRRLFESIGTMYEGYFVLTVTYFPPLLAQQKFVELMFDDDSKKTDKSAFTQDLIKSFRHDCDSLESRLSLAFTLNRLTGNSNVQEDGTVRVEHDFLRWLHYCVTGLSHPIQLPKNPIYLDKLIGGKACWMGVVPKIGKHFIGIVAIDGFPFDSTPGMLNALTEINSEYRWSSRFIFMDTHEAVAHLERYRKKWRQKVRGFFDQVFNLNSCHIDQDAAAMVADAEAAIGEANSGLVGQGYYTSVVVLMNEDRGQLVKDQRVVEKLINKLGFSARIESINAMDAFFGSLPGHAVENVRRPIVNSMNLADLMPSSSIWTGLDHCPCPMYPPNSPPLMSCVTHGSTPFRLNLHVRDVGHTIMFGPTGSGKSTHLALLVAQLRRYQGMTIFAFDKGMSLYPLTAAIRAVTRGNSGKHFDIAADTEKLAFCPLQFLDNKSDRAWAMEWIDTLLALNGVDTTPDQRNEIALAILNMHQSGSRTLSEFTVTIQDEQIRAAMAQYTVDGSMGSLLDAESDGLELSDLTVFEIETLLGLGDRYALPVLLYLFRRIELSLTGQPAAIILDEAWIMLGHPVFRNKIQEWLKVMRKANCLVMMATQSLSDAANSGILDNILEATATKLFLPNLYARDEDTSALYRRMGLNNRQIEILATAVPKRQYYTVSESGRRLYELALGPFALAFVGASDKESVAAIKQLEAKYGDQWIDEWLARKQVNHKQLLAAPEAMP
jgi:type IV secretion/conjugal transfer VirB4 family ATPase